MTKFKTVTLLIAFAAFAVLALVSLAFAEKGHVVIAKDKGPGIVMASERCAKETGPVFASSPRKKVEGQSKTGPTEEQKKTVVVVAEAQPKNILYRADTVSMISTVAGKTAQEGTAFANRSLTGTTMIIV